MDARRTPSAAALGRRPAHGPDAPTPAGRHPLRPTRRGVAVLGTAAVLYAAGANIGSGWVVLLVAALVAAVVADAMAVRVVHRATATAVAVHASGRAGPAIALRTERPAGVARTRVEVPAAGLRAVVGGGTSHLRADLPRTPGPAGTIDTVVRTVGPLGLCAATLPAEVTTVAVLPTRVLPARARVRQVLGSAGAEASRSPGHAEVVGIREHAPGDGSAAVHWRATARRGHLVVRDRARPQGQRVRVEVLTGAWTPPAMLLATTLAASLASAADAAGHDVVLAADGRTWTWSTAAPGPVLEALAALPPQRGGPPRPLQPPPVDPSPGSTLRIGPAGTAVRAPDGTTLADLGEVARWLDGP